MISIFKNKTFLLETLYFVVIAAIIMVVTLINFTEATFEVSRLKDDYFWFQYSLTLILGLSTFFLASQCGKIKKKKAPEIVRVQNELSTYFSYISSNDGLYSKMKEYLKKQNDARKLELYIARLKQKREKAKTQNRIDFFDRKIASAPSDVEFADVKFTRKSINLIFSGFSTKDDDELLCYRGNEQMAEFLVPAILSGLLITAITLAFVLTFTEVSAESIINLCTRLVCIGSYILKGNAYSDYSVGTVYLSALENRKGVVQCFFDDIGYNITIKENPYYMFYGEKEETK
ncbi:MAG: hypothetical protein R3Y18_00460 [Bacillota bacterium]